MANLDNGLTRIEADQTVDSFLTQINNNFSQLQTKIDGAPNKITISMEAPGSGQNGDIWIVYEE